jgi:pimeloyl-ACP methyl ester carboxylesterase
LVAFLIKRTGNMKSFRKFVFALADGIIGLAGFGFLYQTLADQRDQKRYPPPGRMIKVNDHRLHLVCRGEGSLTVVFEAGLGCTHLDWSLVLPEVTKRTRAVAYDRAGSGWSDPIPLPRTGRQMATELHELLYQVGIRGPLILVGHSYGGLIVRLYAEQYPDEVVGLVLVDASHEDQKAHAPRQRSLFTRVKEEVDWQWFRMRPLLARLGFLRWWEHIKPEDRSKLPREVQIAARSVGLRTHAYDWLWTECPSIDITCAQVRGSRLPNHIRTIILAGGNDFQDPVFQNAWLSLQEDLSRKLPNAKYQVVVGSGHSIQLDQPQAVIDAIGQLVQEFNSPPTV